MSCCGMVNVRKRRRIGGLEVGLVEGEGGLERVGGREGVGGLEGVDGLEGAGGFG